MSETQVLLRLPSVKLQQFSDYLNKYRAPTLEFDVELVFRVCTRLRVDPALVPAMWKQELFDIPPGAKLQAIGGGTLQRITHNPLNIKEPATSTRDRYYYKGTWWRLWANWDLGLIDAATYLRQFHGEHNRLTVEQIIPVHCPDIAENFALRSSVYIDNVLRRIREMQSL